MPNIDADADGLVLWYKSKTLRNGQVVNETTPQQVQLMNGVFTFINGVSSEDPITHEKNWTTIDGGTVSTGRLQDNVNGNNYFDLDDGHFNFGDANGNYIRQVGNGVEIKGTLSVSSAVGNTTLSDMVSDIGSAASDIQTLYGDIVDLQGQIDGNISSWFYSVDPAMNLPPVTLDPNQQGTGWDTDAKKQEHLNDTYTNTTSGDSFRFIYENGSYSWLLISDAQVAKALQDSADALDLAEKKNRIFYTLPNVLPTPPYDVGDLWCQGSSGDIKRCATARAEGSSAQTGDWVAASKYTDDTVANTKVKDSQRIYYRSGTLSAPSAPSTWVSTNTNVYNQWTTKVPPLAANKNSGTTKYPYLYSCLQTRTSSSATPTCTSVLLDEDTLVIDGGNIIANSITANQINTSAINVGDFHDDGTYVEPNDNVSVLTNDGTYATGIMRSLTTSANRSSTYATYASWVGLSGDTWSSITDIGNGTWHKGDFVRVPLTVTDRDNASAYMLCRLSDYNSSTQLMTVDNIQLEMDATASKYVTTIDSTGVMVHPSNDSTTGWKISSALELLKSGVTYIKAWITSGNIPTVQVGRDDKGHTVIDENGMRVYGGSNGSSYLANIGYGDTTNAGGSTTGAPYFSLGSRNTSHGIGGNSATIGYDADARGYCSIAFGRNASARQNGSVAIGEGTLAELANTVAVGKYNTTYGGGATETSDNQYAFMIGNGSSSSSSNAFTVTRSGDVNIPSGKSYKVNGSAHTHGGSTISSLASGLFSISDAEVSIASLAGSTNKYNTKSLTKSGYYPLGVVGHNTSGSNIAGINVYNDYLSDRASGSATLNWGVRNTFASTATSSDAKVTFKILWCKV